MAGRSCTIPSKGNEKLFNGFETFEITQGPLAKLKEILIL